jgi:hypothetical protein
VEGKAVNIRITTEVEPVEMRVGLDELLERLERVTTESPGAPFIKVQDAEGGFHLLNVNHITHIWGPE